MEGPEEDRPPEPMEYHSEDATAPDVDESAQYAAGRESTAVDGTHRAKAHQSGQEPVAAKEPVQGMGAGNASAARSPSFDEHESVKRDPSVKMLMEIFPGRIRSVTGPAAPEQDEPIVGEEEEVPGAGALDPSPNQDPE